MVSKLTPSSHDHFLLITKYYLWATCSKDSDTTSVFDKVNYFLIKNKREVEWWNPEWNADLFSLKEIPAVVIHRVSIASISMHPTKINKIYLLSGLRITK